jgi:hypothetical protein
MKGNHDKKSGQSVLDFQIGEIVRVKNFRDGLEKYVKGVIAKRLGPYRYLVKIGTRCRFVHLEHLHKTGELDLNSGINVPEHELSASEVPHHASTSDVVNEETSDSSTHVDVPENISQSPVKTGPVPKTPLRYSLRKEVKAPKRLIETMRIVTL